MKWGDLKSLNPKDSFTAETLCLCPFCGDTKRVGIIEEAGAVLHEGPPCARFLAEGPDIFLMSCRIELDARKSAIDAAEDTLLMLDAVKQNMEGKGN